MTKNDRIFYLILGAIGIIVILIFTIINISTNVPKLQAQGNVEKLAKVMLSNSNQNKRIAAAYALGELRDPSSKEALVSVFSDENADLRLAAVEALGQYKDIETSADLINMLNDKSKSVQLVSHQALLNLGEDAIPSLLEASSKNSLRNPIISILLDMGEPTIIPLIATLDQPDSNQVRLAKMALEQLSPLSHQPLIAALASEQEMIRDGARSILLKIGDPVSDELLLALNEEAFQAQIVSILIEMGSFEALIDSVDSYPQISDPLIQVLITQLSNKDISVKNTAKLQLERFGEAAAPALIQVLGNNSSFPYASDLLKRMGEKALPSLLNIGLEHEDEEIVVRTLRILGEISNNESLPAVIKMFNHSFQPIRLEAARTLEKMTPLEAVPDLIEAYKDKDSNVKKAVHEALIAIFKTVEQDIQKAAMQICTGKAVPGTVPFELKYGDKNPHPFVVLDYSRSISFITYKLPPDWLPFSVEEIQGVVCLSIAQSDVVETCSYSGNVKVKRIQYKQGFILRSAFDGAILEGDLLLAEKPSGCPYIKLGSGDIHGPAVDVNQLLAWFRKWGYKFDLP